MKLAAAPWPSENPLPPLPAKVVASHTQGGSALNPGAQLSGVLHGVGVAPPPVQYEPAGQATGPPPAQNEPAEQILGVVEPAGQ